MFKGRLFAGLGVWLAIALGFYAAVYLQTTFTQGGNPHFFFHPENLSNLLGQAAVVGILACGMTLIIVAGHIDLSVGSLLGMLGAMAAWLMSDYSGWGWNVAAAVAAVIVLGVLLGAAQGALIAYLEIPSFVVTLGGLLVFRGVLLLVAKSTIPIEANFVTFLGSATFPGEGGFPVRFLLMLVLMLVVHTVAARTRFGRYLYAIGGNRQAAYYSGISVQKQLVGAFALMGAIAGLAGLVFTGFQMAADAGAGDLMELYAIAACVLGGTSLRGGKGSVPGAVVGALIMATIRNGLSCLGVPNSGEKIILGVILVIAVASDILLSRKKS